MTNYLETYRRDRTPGYIPGIQPLQGIYYPGGITPFIYLQADSLISIGEGNIVDSWTDSCVGNHPATQAVSVYAPVLRTNYLNGHCAVEFDGTDDYLTFGDISSHFPSEATVVLVVGVESDEAYSLLGTSTPSPDESWWRYNGDGQGYNSTWRASRKNNYPASMPSSGVYIMALRSSSSNFEMFLDGVSQGAQTGDYSAGSVYNIPDNWIGDIYYRGKIACALLYDTSLNDTNIGLVTSGLQSMYNL